MTFQFKIKIFGEHNVLNAVAAIILSFDEGIDYKNIQKSLISFPQVERRFEIINKNVFLKKFLIDDYGHHPTELINTIKTIKEFGLKKKWLWLSNLIDTQELKRFFKNLSKYYPK